MVLIKQLRFKVLSREQPLSRGSRVTLTFYVVALFKSHLGFEAAMDLIVQPN